MADPAARSLASRVRHAIAFVAVVWGVAATFVAFEFIALGGVDVVASFPALFGDLALSRVVTASTSCTVAPVSGTSEPRPPAAGLPDVRVGAWQLGVSLGRDAVFRQLAGSNPALLEQTVEGLRALAAELSVPAPSVFRAGQIANANTEFVAFVENDGTGTARGFAERSSSQTCELFKLAAMWGYSEIVRPALPGERAVFAQEIRYHAQRAQVPEALWSPMLERLPANARAEEVRAQMGMLTDGMTAHLAGR